MKKRSVVGIVGLLIVCNPKLGLAQSTTNVNLGSEQANAPPLVWGTPNNSNSFDYAYNVLSTNLNALNDAGVHLRSQLLVDPYTNPIGGVQRAADVAAQFQVGADLDLQKLIDIPGARFHITIYQQMGQNLASSVGTDFGFQASFKNDFEHVHLGVLMYQQSLLDNRLTVLIGRMGTAFQYAQVSEQCAFFVGVTCGSSQLLKAQSGLTLPPSSTWGAKVSYKITPNFYFATGANEVNPTTSASGGTAFSVRSATGYALPFELGYDNHASSAPYPFAIKVGEIYSAGPHSDPFLNTKGQSLGLHGGKPLQDNTRNVAYIIGDKTLWRPNPRSTENIGVYAGYFQQLDVTEDYRYELDSGAVWTGPLPNRPADKLGFEVYNLMLTSAARDFLRDARIKAGGSGNNNPNEFGLEADYDIILRPGIELSPDVDYVIHPDNLGRSDTPKVPNNALIVGFDLYINFGELAGLPAAAGINQ